MVQYWRDVGEAVLEQMRAFAVAKSVTDGKKVWFGVVEGVDSYRLLRAYPKMFPASSKRK